MNWYGIPFILVGALIAAASIPIERKEGPGKAGTVLLGGTAVVFVGLFILFS